MYLWLPTGSVLNLRRSLRWGWYGEIISLQNTHLSFGWNFVEGLTPKTYGFLTLKTTLVPSAILIMKPYLICSLNAPLWRLFGNASGSGWISLEVCQIFLVQSSRLRKTTEVLYFTAKQLSLHLQPLSTMFGWQGIKCCLLGSLLVLMSLCCPSSIMFT